MCKSIIKLIKSTKLIKLISLFILLTLSLLLQGCFFKELSEKAGRNYKPYVYRPEERITDPNEIKRILSEARKKEKENSSSSSFTSTYSGTDISLASSKTNNKIDTPELYAVESELQTMEGEDDGELELLGCDEEEIECELGDLQGNNQ